MSCICEYIYLGQIYYMNMMVFLLICMMVWMGTTAPTQKPIIGIYTQDAEEFSNDASTYIAASYVKNIQMAGGQVVPLMYHWSEQKLADTLSKINGVFFPGGQMPIDMDNLWTSRLNFIFQYVTARNREGMAYPLWATCLGYEAIMYVSSGLKDNTTLFTAVKGQDGRTCPLIVKDKNSELLRSLNAEEYKDATSDDGIFFYHHRWSVKPSTFNTVESWRSMWNVVTTSVTSDNIEFLSTLEAKDFPYFLTQYHPEKNSFEWRVPAKRTFNAISAEQKFINVFMRYARQNPNTYPAQELAKDIIYNYQPTLTPLTYAFVQVYIFNESQSSII